MAISSGTSFSSISQEKKPSPASPDQSVPSQSKEAIRGLNWSTESINAWERLAAVKEGTGVPGKRNLPKQARTLPRGREIVKDGPGCGPRGSAALRNQEGILLGRIDVGDRHRVVNIDEDNLLRITIPDLAGVGGGRRLQECFDQLAARNERMAVLALEARNRTPLEMLRRAVERFGESSDAGLTNRWTINESHHGSVASVIQNFPQAHLQGTELTEVGRRIHHHGGSRAVDDRGQSGGVSPGDDQNQFGVEGERLDRRREEGPGGCLPGSSRGPWQERLVRAHADGITSGEDDAAKAKGAAHGPTIAEADGEVSIRRRSLIGLAGGLELVGRCCRFLPLRRNAQEPAHVRERPLGLAANGDEFGRDRDGDFFRRDGADVEPDGGVDAFEEAGGETLFLQLAGDGDGLALGPDHADISGLRLHRPAEDAHIVAVAARDDDDVGGFVGREPAHGLVEVFGNHLTGFGETLPVGVGVTVVNDDGVEARHFGSSIEVCGHMAGAKYIK